MAEQSTNRCTARRELLLAFAWLAGKVRLFDRYLSHLQRDDIQQRMYTDILDTFQPVSNCCVAAMYY